MFGSTYRAVLVLVLQAVPEGVEPVGHRQSPYSTGIWFEVREVMVCVRHDVRDDVESVPVGSRHSPQTPYCTGILFDVPGGAGSCRVLQSVREDVEPVRVGYRQSPNSAGI